MQNPVRRLIETDEVPIGQISEHSRKDQNVRKGHLHTLHVWWATRPLAACRAEEEQLEQLRAEVRGLRDRVRPIRPRTTTTIALVATDAGEHLIAFDPHLFYVLRVVDSFGQALFRDGLTYFQGWRGEVSR